MRFLIADIDGESNRELNLVLSEFGLCDVKPDLKSIYRLFDDTSQALQYKALFLNLAAPEGKAVDALKHIRKHYRRIYDKLRFIVLDESEENIAIMGLCASHKLQFIKKPIDKWHLLRILRDMSILSEE